MPPQDDERPGDPAATDADPAELIAAARDAAERAIAPYSGYAVGAAVDTPEGRYLGCNLEVANYSNSLHAEEVALAAALSDGVREIDALAVTTASGDGATPCGACRQTLWEFCEPDLPVYCDAGDDWDGYELRELLPAAFEIETE